MKPTPTTKPLFPNQQVHSRIDLRPALDSAWKIVEGYPRAATQLELDSFEVNVTQDKDSPIQVFKHITYHRSTTITQFFTLGECYLGGGEYPTVMSEQAVFAEFDNASKF